MDDREPKIKTYKSVAAFLKAMGKNGKPAKAVYFKVVKKKGG